MDLETLIQSEISQKQKNKYILMHICGISDLIAKYKQRHRFREQTSGYHGGKQGLDELRDWDEQIHINGTMYKVDK